MKPPRRHLVEGKKPASCRSAGRVCTRIQSTVVLIFTCTACNSCIAIMVDLCVAYGCTNRTKKTPGVTFHRQVVLVKADLKLAVLLALRRVVLERQKPLIVWLVGFRRMLSYGDFGHELFAAKAGRQKMKTACVQFTLPRNALTGPAKQRGCAQAQCRQCFLHSQNDYGHR